MRVRLASLLFALAACSKSGGRVTGEVYFAAADGEGKRASSVAVRLLRNPDTVDTRIGRACTEYGTHAANLKTRLLESLLLITGASEPTERLARMVKYGPVADARTDSIYALSLATVAVIN